MTESAEQGVDFRVTHVDSPEFGVWKITLEGGGRLDLSWADFEFGTHPGVTFRAGDTVRIYAHEGELHGVDFEGVPLLRRTSAERAARPEGWAPSTPASMTGSLIAAGEAFHARAAGLSEPMRAHFARVCEDARYLSTESDFLSYMKAVIVELGICLDADRIAALLRDMHGWSRSEAIAPDEAKVAVEVFLKLPWAKKKQRLLNLDNGHTAGTLNRAANFAYFLLTQQAF